MKSRTVNCKRQHKEVYGQFNSRVDVNKRELKNLKETRRKYKQCIMERQKDNIEKRVRNREVTIIRPSILLFGVHIQVMIADNFPKLIEKLIHSFKGSC